MLTRMITSRRSRPRQSGPSSLLLGLLMTSLFLGCTAEEVSLELVGVRQVESSSCAVDFNNQLYVALGLMDLVVAGNYVANVEVASNLSDNLATNNQSSLDGRVNTNNVTLTSVELRYLDSEGVGVELEPLRTIDVGLRLVSGGGGAPLAIGVELITPAMAEELISNQELFFNDAGTALARRLIRI